MRIDPTSPTRLEPRDATAPKSEPAAPESDVVALSPAGTTAASAPSPEQDLTARLARIRALVQQGAYPIDLDLLASRIVHDEILRNKGPA